MAEKTLEDQIRDGKRLEQLLEDTATKEALEDLDKEYWKEAKSSNSDAERLAAIAKARALEDLNRKFRAVVHNGNIATAQSKRNAR